MHCQGLIELQANADGYRVSIHQDLSIQTWKSTRAQRVFPSGSDPVGCVSSLTRQLGEPLTRPHSTRDAGTLSVYLPISVNAQRQWHNTNSIYSKRISLYPGHSPEPCTRLESDEMDIGTGLGIVLTGPAPSPKIYGQFIPVSRAQNELSWAETIQCYGVFTPEQDNDKTTTRQMLNLCIPMMSFTPDMSDLVWKAS